MQFIGKQSNWLSSWLFYITFKGVLKKSDFGPKFAQGGGGPQTLVKNQSSVLFFCECFPYLWTLSGRGGGGGSDQFCTFLGYFCMCVENTNRLYLVLKHLTLVPRYHAYLRSWWQIKVNAMVYTSLYAFPGVYEGRKKSTPLVSVVIGGGGPPPPPRTDNVCR